MNEQLNSRGEYIKSTDCSREEQLKQAIEDRENNLFEAVAYCTQEYFKRVGDIEQTKSFELGINAVLQIPSILRHCDPEIMKQAGWVREEELQPIASVPDLLKECPTCDSKSMGIFIYPQTLKVNEVDVSANYTVVKCLECNREFTTDEIDEININNFKQSADKPPKQ